MNELEKITSDYWENGSNCAQSSACGLLKFFDNTKNCKMVHDLMLTYGGGVGERSICGAILGSIGAINILMSEKNISEIEIRDISRRFKAKFSDKWGSLYCGNLIEDFIDNDGNVDPLDMDRKEMCTRIVLKAVAIAKEMIKEKI